MPYLRLLCLILSFMLISPLSYSAVKVSSYDVNSAIQTTSADGAINKSNVIASSENKKLDVLGFWFVNSGLSYSDDVVVMRVAFNNFLFDSADGSVSVKDINMYNDLGIFSFLIGEAILSSKNYNSFIKKLLNNG